MLPRSQVLVAGCLFLLVFWVLLSGVYVPSDVSDPLSTSTSRRKSVSENIAEINDQIAYLTSKIDIVLGKSSSNVVVPSIPLNRKRRLAYGFYATNDNYACSTLNIAKSIEDVGGKKRSDVEFLVLHTPEVSERFVSKLKAFGFRTVPTKVIENEAVGPYHGLWKHSVTKLSIFNMTEYDRIIYLDADALAVKNFDWLFDLPPNFLYSPRAYWLWDKQPWFNAQMFILEPSDQAFRKQMNFFERNEKEGKVFYDMDVANEVFRNEAAILPGSYQLVNTDLMHPGYTKISTLFDKTVDQLSKEAFVVHFTEGPKMTYGKPWHVSSMEEVQIPDGSHPMFKDLFRRWFEYRDSLCL
ncbi:hypothetical protein HK096_006146 [Nowakowskiella sp. JEL0078]|nr:hypothetical protein HK096_006146 [Nowakowskiella sp. JEL0078]